MEFEKYLFQPRPLHELVKDPTVKIVIDTNVLLAAYQWRKVTVDQIIKTLKGLARQNRLVVPAHVVSEFVRNRPKMVADMLREIDNELSSKFNAPRKLVEVVPALNGTAAYATAQENLDKLLASSKAYKKALESLRDTLMSLLDSDPVLDAYAEVLSSSYYAPETLKDTALLEKEAEERYKKNIPPGTKDATKETNKAGDYIVWRHILELQSDVIFVTLDHKPDWAVTSSDILVSAKHELVLEFYERTNGKSFRLVSPREFFVLIEPHLSEEAKDDLSSASIFPNVEKISSTPMILNDNDNFREFFWDQIVSHELTKIANEALSGIISYRGKVLTPTLPRCSNCGVAVNRLIDGLCADCKAIKAQG